MSFKKKSNTNISKYLILMFFVLQTFIFSETKAEAGDVMWTSEFPISWISQPIYYVPDYTTPIYGQPETESGLTLLGYSVYYWATEECPGDSGCTHPPVPSTWVKWGISGTFGYAYDTTKLIAGTFVAGTTKDSYTSGETITLGMAAGTGDKTSTWGGSGFISDTLLHWGDILFGCGSLVNQFLSGIGLGSSCKPTHVFVGAKGSNFTINQSQCSLIPGTLWGGGFDSWCLHAFGEFSTTATHTFTAPTTPGNYTINLDGWIEGRDGVDFSRTNAISFTVTSASCPAYASSTFLWTDTTSAKTCTYNITAPLTSSGGTYSAPVSTTGYSGSLVYSCNNGSWTLQSGSCTLITTPQVNIQFK